MKANNNRYFSAREIYTRISSTYKNKISEYNVVDIMRWCAELVVEILRDPYDRIRCNKIRCGFGPSYTITANRVPMPPFVFKLVAVRDENNRLLKDFSYQGEYLYFPDNNIPKEVYIDYDTVPLDNDGFPLMKRGFELAAYAYCVYKMFEEDSVIVPPRIAQWKWKEIEYNKDREIEAAARSWEEITDNEAHDIMRYMIDPAYLRVTGAKIYDELSGGNVSEYNSNVI